MHLLESRFISSKLLKSGHQNSRGMEATKRSPPTPAAAGAAPQPASGFFSSIFPASPVVPSLRAANAKDAKQTDLYTMLNKQNSKGQNGGGIADGKCQGNPTKGRAAYKDGNQIYPNESSKLPYFGSSVCYGGQEFYGSSPRKQDNESSRNYKEDNPDVSLATRGDWWQGSLYY